MHIRTCVHTHTHVCTNIYMYTCTHIYIYTHAYINYVDKSIQLFKGYQFSLHIAITHVIMAESHMPYSTPCYLFHHLKRLKCVMGQESTYTPTSCTSPEVTKRQKPASWQQSVVINRQCTHALALINWCTYTCFVSFWI